MKIVISGVAWVTAASLGQGRKNKKFAWPEGGSLVDFSLKKLLKKVPPRYGRLDDFSKLGLAAIGLALEDAGRDEWETKRDMGLIAATTFGCLESDLNYYATVDPQEPTLASPNLFAYTLPNCFIGEVSIAYGLTGTNFVLRDNSADPFRSLKMAFDSIRWGESSAMVAGVLDRPLPQGLVYPFPHKPGAIFVVLEQAPHSDHPYGEIAFDNDSLLFEGEKQNDLTALVETCLK